MSQAWPMISLFFLSTTVASGQELSTAKSDLRYSSKAGNVFYSLQAKVDFGDERAQDFAATLTYAVEYGGDGKLKVFDTVRPKSSRSAYYGSGRDNFYKLSRNLFAGGSSSPAVISDMGKLIDVNVPNWMLGLPVDLSRLAFPLLGDTNEWTLEEPVSLVNGRRGGLQLAAVSPQIRGDRRGYDARRSAPAESVVAILKTLRKVSDRSEERVTIVETFELDGSGFEPQVSLSGSGTVVFSTIRGGVDSIQRTYKVTCKEPNRQLVVPITVSLSRFTDEQMVAYLAEQKARAERSAKIRAEQEAMRKQVPDLSERDAVMKIVTDQSKESRALFELLVSKMDSEKLADDAELAMVLYEQMFKRERPPYRLKDVIVRLAPDLEKTTALAAKYTSTYSSFDAAMTGDEISADTKLTKDQIICYRKSGSSFRPGHLYGAVEDVLVLRTRSARPELVAIKREDCRLPVRDFIDPALK